MSGSVHKANLKIENLKKKKKCLKFQPSRRNVCDEGREKYEKLLKYLLPEEQLQTTSSLRKASTASGRGQVLGRLLPALLWAQG